MNRHINRCIRYMIRKFESTGLEQDLNHSKPEGKLAVPEISDVCRKIAADGIVLLKNDNQTLPIRKDDTVAVFGRCAIDYFTVGYGSGGDVVAPYRSCLMDGLLQQRVKLCKPLYDTYRSWCSAPKNVPDEGFWGHWPMSHPEMPLKKDLVEAAARESDLAIVVIGRAAGESRENLLKKGSYYLTDREMAMLRLVTSCFGRVAVIMDCGNIIDMSWLDEFGDRIGAIIYAWQGGMESGYALADVLTGKVSPSGKLTDSIARNYRDYPASGNFAGRKFNAYAEDIYVGYRYFETFAPEKVLYPFGFGLSYTSFSVTSKAERDDMTIRIHARVCNEGNRAGREVVQIFLEAPCGKLGKPKRVLTGFRKTDVLRPGEATELDLSFDLMEFASYDDSGVTGHPNCYVLEEGTYRIIVGTNIRDGEMVLQFELPDLICTERLMEQCAVAPAHSFRRMHNCDGELTFEPVPVAGKDLKQEILDALPNELPAGKACAFADVLTGKATAEEFVSQLTDEELDEISHGAGKMNYRPGALGNAGAFGGVTEKLRSRGLPAVITTDGPSGIRVKNTCALLPCGTALASTFDPMAVSELYALVGKEMVIRGSDMLLAPGMNIHRNPLCGRNFEYFSEDPYLTGMIAAAVVRGVQRSGVSACPKHFACNNQETNRNRNDSRVSQRALREIYLKSFELVVKEAVPMAIMTSYNRINGVWGHYHYELVSNILRKEWDYKGLVITDWWMQPDVSREFPHIKNDAYRLRAGVDVLMPGEFKDRTVISSLKDPEGLTRAEAQQIALHVVRFILQLKRDSKA